MKLKPKREGIPWRSIGTQKRLGRNLALRTRERERERESEREREREREGETVRAESRRMLAST
jgi:hypothetical protein